MENNVSFILFVHSHVPCICVHINPGHDTKCRKSIFHIQPLPPTRQTHPASTSYMHWHSLLAASGMLTCASCSRVTPQTATRVHSSASVLAHKRVHHHRALAVVVVSGVAQHSRLRGRARLANMSMLNVPCNSVAQRSDERTDGNDDAYTLRAKCSESVCVRVCVWLTQRH